MSNPLELRERFKKESGGKKQPPVPLEVRANVAEVLGLTIQDMRDSIIADIEAMIKKGYRPALEGYVLCLSRIINHDTAWEYILEAFHNKNESVPSKYYKQFGKTSDDISPKKRISVQ